MTRGLALLLALAVPAAVTAAPTLESYRGHRRVLLVAGNPADPRLAQQRRLLAGWRRGAAARDLVVVEVAGEHVHGSADRAKLLRHQWRLPPTEFQAVLIGKDGHEALRQARPLAPRELARAIDAMPMRRAGRR